MSSNPESGERWEGRPWVAALVRTFVLVAPIAASVVFVHVVSRLVAPPSGSTALYIGWWVGLSALATVVLIGIDRLTRRLLPLAALLKLALVFPDEAPSRFRAALSAGTTEGLEQRLAEARKGLDDETPVEAAERLLGFAAALSAHDHVTRGHSERVRAYAQMIAKELRLDREEVDRLNWAALLHDIGKLEVPAEILNKPGRPTEEEWQAIRSHPELGARLAAPLRAWLGEWTDAIADHHERWDGKGYPKGVEREQISLAGRIVAVADVFDVITSSRSYKDPENPAAARDEIARCAGVQFDPRVVRAFLGISLGRLRLAMGPLSWLAQAPILGRIPLTPGVATLASSAVAVAGSFASGLVEAPRHAPQFTPSAAAATTHTVPLATYTAAGGRVVAAAPRGGGAHALRVVAAHAKPLAAASTISVAALPVSPPPEPPPAPVDSPPPAPAATPLFAAGADVSVDEDAAPQRIAGWATAIHRHTTFSASTGSPSLFAGSGQPALGPDGTLTFTPAPDANGTARVTVTAQGHARDGSATERLAQSFRVTVTPVNDPPSFTAGSDESVLEGAAAQTFVGWADAITAGPADEANQSLHFAVTTSDGALFGAGGQPAVTADGTLTFVPAAFAVGTASIGVRALDDGGSAAGGADTSAAQTRSITVASVNDAPSFSTGADQTVLEDAGPQSVAGWASAISPGPADEAGQSVTFRTSSSNAALFTAGGQPAVAPSGTLTYTPAPDAAGVATVTIRAVDDGGTALGGSDTSAAKTFSITLLGVNDPPSFSAGADQTALEDAGPQSVAGWASAIAPGPAGESGQTVGFNVSSSNPALFTSGGQPAVTAGGTLTYTPAPDAVGIATISISATDDGGTANGGADTSGLRTFSIALTAVNDSPSFTSGADQTALEDSAAQIVPGWATAISPGPGNEAAQSVAFTTSNSNPALFTAGGQPALTSGGTLTYTPAADAAGVATVTIQAVDSGGTANAGVDTSAAQTMQITLTAVNDVPSFTAGADQTVVENSGPQSAPGWATSISPGPADEATQNVGFTLTSSNPALFAFGGQPAVASNGGLTFTPAAGAHGTATVTIRAVDDGGTANGGVDTSAPQTFTITITNLPPTAIADSPSVAENDAAGVTFNVLANDTDPEGDPLGVASYDDSTIANGSVTANGGGSFTYVPAAHFAGTDSFSYTVSDGNGGASTALVTITVTPVPDPPATADDAYLTARNTPLTQAAPGVLANDSDAISGGTLTVDTTPVVAPGLGTLSLAADGSFLYTPNPGQTGSDIFTYRATSSATGLSSDAVVTITISATSSSSLLYLTGTGPSSELWDLTATPPAASLLVPDYDNNLSPGLTIKSSDGKDNPDPAKAQTWRFPLSSSLTLNGPVTLHLSSIQTGSPGDGTAYAYLYDCTAGGVSCTQIAFGRLADKPWNSLGVWAQHDITVGTVSRTLPAGHELRLRLYVGQGDQWIAMTAALPTSLTLTLP
jgi:putative nucleotidyltransferase with HDIG domain